MKILFVLGFPNPFAGAAWRIGFLAEMWSKKGIDVDVLGTFTPKTLNKKGSKLRKGKNSAFHIFNLIPRVYLKDHPSIFIINTLLAFLFSSVFLLAKRPSQAIISVPTGDVGLGVMIACKIAAIKYIIDYRDEWEDYTASKFKTGNKKLFYRYLKKITAYLYSKSSCTVTVSLSFKSSLKSRGVSNIILMPNGADTSIFNVMEKSEIRKKLNISTKDFVMIYTGIIGEYYKIGTIIRTFANNQQISNFKFLLVGDGPVSAI